MFKIGDAVMTNYAVGLRRAGVVTALASDRCGVHADHGKIYVRWDGRPEADRLPYCAGMFKRAERALCSS